MTESLKRAAPGLVLFAFALGLRLAHIRAVETQPIGGVLVQDAAYYHAEALRLIESGPPIRGVSFMNLGYPYVLAAIYEVLGPRPVAVLWVQAALGALTAVLVALAARRLLESAAAAGIAGVLYAVYAPALFYEGLLLVPAAANVLVAAALIGVCACRGRPSWWPPVAAGVAVGLAALLRAASFLYVPILVPVVAFAESTRQRGMLRATILAAGAALVVLPLIVSGGLREGRWVPLTANGGMNFWVGNNRSAEGIYYAADFVHDVGAAGEERGFLDEARRRTGRSELDLAEADRFWWREARRDVRERLGRWLRIEARKLALFWNRHETRTNVGMEFVAGFSPVLRVLPGFGVLAVLGLAGLAALIAARRMWPAAVLTTFTLVPMAVCIVFFVSGEYRHPIAPALCVAAAAPVALRFGDKRTSSLMPYVAAAAVGALAVPLVAHRFPPLTRTDHPRLDYANYAKALCAEPAIPQALALLEHGRNELGDDPFLLDATMRVQVIAALGSDDGSHARDALNTAGLLWAWVAQPGADGYPERFLQETFVAVDRSVALLAKLPPVRSDVELARTAALLGGDGYDELDRAIRRGDLDGADELVRAAVALAPRSARALMAAGRLALARGDDVTASGWFRRAMDGWPRSADPAVELARILEAHGEAGGARIALEEALRRQPDHQLARKLLIELPR